MKGVELYKKLVSQISETFVQGQQKAVLAVNASLVETYWKIGQYIIEYEQGGSEKAEYGKKLLEQLSKDLSLLHGKGFGVSSNIYRMRQFYLVFPILAKASQILSWSHYVELLKIDDPMELIDLKRETAGYEDIGQMNMYLEIPTLSAYERRTEMDN